MLIVDDSDVRAGSCRETDGRVGSEPSDNECDPGNER